MSKTFQQIIGVENPKPRLVNGRELLHELFSDDSRPTARWLDDRIAKREIPFVKIGRLVFFDVGKVREALENQTCARVL